MPTPTSSREAPDEGQGLFRWLVGDGVPLLLVGAGSLILAGGLALFLALSGEFLPHDIRYLGMSATDLCSLAECRVVGFMVHDRAAFGGALVAVGIIYLYVVAFPLRRGEVWAWWLLVGSVTAGFASFLAYLGYGYLDTWHGAATLVLAPIFVAGLARSRRLVAGGRGGLTRHVQLPDVLSREGLGRGCLLAGAAAVGLAGLEILRIGVTQVLIPEDLAFMGVSAEQLRAANPRLIPLLAHDRAGFGGAVFTTGFTAFGCLLCSRMTRALWETMLAAGVVSLTAAVGIHLAVGYVDLWHLLPPITAAVSLLVGLALTFDSAFRPGAGAAP